VGVVQSFSGTLLVEEDDQFKYADGFHFYELCMWGEKESSTRACSPRWAHYVYVNGSLKSAMRGSKFSLPFYFLLPVLSL
jgi:hypothetical protein